MSNRIEKFLGLNLVWQSKRWPSLKVCTFVCSTNVVERREEVLGLLDRWLMMIKREWRCERCERSGSVKLFIYYCSYYASAQCSLLLWLLLLWGVCFINIKTYDFFFSLTIFVISFFIVFHCIGVDVFFFIIMYSITHRFAVDCLWLLLLLLRIFVVTSMIVMMIMNVSNTSPILPIPP